jgi:hypothetical protein
MVADWRYRYGDPKSPQEAPRDMIFFGCADDPMGGVKPWLPSGFNQNDPRPRHLASRQSADPEHGADAEIVSARRADEMLERGDHDGQLVWLRIRRAIVELQTLSVSKPN